MKPKIILCGPKLYSFEGLLFEFGHCGFHPLKQDGEPYQRIPREFWGMIERFQKIKSQEFYRVGGGCQFIY
jgi:hypothetical protein